MTALILFAVIGVCAVPWVTLASRRFGHLFAVPAVGMLTVLVLFAAMIVGRFTGAGILISTGTVVIAGGIVGAVLATRGGAWRWPRRHAVAVWVPAMLGGVAWVGALAIAQVLPSAAKLSWALNGDANNNLYFAGLIIDQHGVALGAAENPVPLTAALLALGIAPGQPTGDPLALLAHDFTGLGVVWMLLLAATALGAGAVAASIIERSRTGLVAVASAAGSLLPLTWFVAGLPIEYGYLNAHLVLPIALAAWLIYVASPGRVVPAIAVQLCIATLLLATWSPWVVLPVGFIVALAVHHSSTLRTMDARAAWPALVAVVPAIVWLAVATGPALVSNGSTFEIPGHGLPAVLPIVVVALVLLLLGGRALRTQPPVFSGAIAVAAATVAGSGALVFLARDSGAFTGYYPAKFLWVSAVIVGVIVLSFTFALLSRTRRPLLGITAVAVLVIIAASLGPPLKRPGVVRPPLERILSGAVWATGDRSVDLILANSDPADPGILWNSGEPDEAFADFWIALKLGGELGNGSGTGDPTLRGFAFTAYQQYRDTGAWAVPPVEQLCEVVTAIGGPVRVITGDAGLEVSIQSTCPAVNARIDVTLQ
ncbi:hypothetical protein QMG61_15435 [Cryobacterium sp. PH31-AA6]|uniref:hypothetical protein n=1 Tax=Cryobacterium sp. PH31-AA6 TaxID=3046205 RepID=UPI0024BAE957|nr:hypothetical protein [Cryobacterium sp. PH31-AA6]MDJ0325158.1 hypothetical protein [Cryobacterium sp. PH31-AA6]